MAEERVSYKIMAHVGVLEKNASGWTKEVNVVSWNGGQAKLDIRDWDPEHEKMSRGITLTADETQRLISSVSSRDAVGLLKDLNRQTRSNDYER